MSNDMISKLFAYATLENRQFTVLVRGVVHWLAIDLLKSNSFFLK